MVSYKKLGVILLIAVCLGSVLVTVRARQGRQRSLEIWMKLRRIGEAGQNFTFAGGQVAWSFVKVVYFLVKKALTTNRLPVQ